MHLTLNKRSALRLLRIARGRRGRLGLPRERVDLAIPDPSPQLRWSKRLFLQALASWDPEALGHDPLEVCVPSKGACLGSRLVSNTVYAGTLPRVSFIPLDRTLAIPCPELLFVELAEKMTLPEHLLLGFELCGSYSLNADSPVQGKAVFEIPPATTVERIGLYIKASGRVKGKRKAQRTLALLANGAWSPMEAIIATMVSLPLEEHGYGFGRCRLNERVTTPALLADAAKKGSRVPDILIAGTKVGFNYDGEYHLDLDPLIEASIAFAREPGSSQRERELLEARGRVRAQVIDDNRRNRELVSGGHIVFPVFKEDLYDETGLDGVMMQAMAALQLYDGWKDDGRFELIAARAARAERRALLSSLLPGRTLEVESAVPEAIVSLKYRQRSQAQDFPGSYGLRR